MSKLNKGMIAASVLLTLVTAALASDSSEWIMKPNQGYVPDKTGKINIVDLKIDDAMLARAEVVRPGTVFFMHNGQVMSGFDRSLIGIGSH